MQSWNEFLRDLLQDLSKVEGDMVLLVMLVIVAGIVVDAMTTSARKRRERSGLTNTSSALSIDGSAILPSKEFISDKLGLAGRPDALIMENGLVIPVEIKPLAKKIRDRHVAQLLVYLRLVEEAEGTRPPYGYLIVGANCRRVKIENSEQRQAWLQKHLDQMHAIVEGAPTVATPQREKCRRCDVRESCVFKL